LYKKSNQDWFYPTRMATILTSDAISIRTSSAAMNSVIDKTKGNTSSALSENKMTPKMLQVKKINEANEFAKRQLIEKDNSANTGTSSNMNYSQELVNGAVILETNFKLYSYANSPLQIAILSLFVQLKSRFNNMVLGQITRDSIRRALRNGITAEQILAYLETHAHPQMIKLAEEQLEKKIGIDNMKKRQMDIENGKGNEGNMFQLQILPPTVVDQIKLWQIELDRVISADGYLYSDFSTMKEYTDLVKYCQDIGVLVWKNDRKKIFFVEKEGNDQVIEYAKRLLSKSN
jgi:transcription initiation factor TFIIH subunit 4